MTLQNTDPRAIKRFQTLEDDFNKVHNNKYDYSKFVYINSGTKGIIICPIHGEFLQSSANHLKGAGCPKCGFESTHNQQRKTTEQFIEEAIEVHGDKYNYNASKYKGANKKLNIICLSHGIFSQIPSSHLSGQGCPYCAGNINKTTEQFIEEAIAIHGDKYDYSKVEYKGAHKKLEIGCKIHGYFWQTASNHINGQGCPICAEIERKKKYFNKPTILYYIKIEKPGFPTVWKIGITIHSVEKRYRDDVRNGCKITILNEEHFKIGKEAWNKEQLIINSLSKYKYNGEDVLIGGNSELFTEDCYLL